MSEFYSKIQGARGAATRCGNRSGIWGYLNSWYSGVSVEYIGRGVDRKEDPVDNISIHIGKYKGYNNSIKTVVDLKIDAHEIPDITFMINGLNIPVKKLRELENILTVANIVIPDKEE
jgi:hypothetical protein